MKNSFFNSFTPKEPKFFPLLKSLSDVMITAADLLIEATKTDNHDNQSELYRLIKEQERLGDSVSHRVFDELNATFITPFDREDIHHLANYLDDVIDGINSSAKRIMLYKPISIPPEATELANLIKEGALYIGKAMDELPTLKKNAKQLKVYCAELHDLENRADDVYESFVIKLFEEEGKTIEIIKLKEILYEMEKTTDTQEYVGKVIRTIIIKYA